jgi:hypothetical protein
VLTDVPPGSAPAVTFSEKFMLHQNAEVPIDSL